MNDPEKKRALQFLQKHSGMVLSTLSSDHSIQSAYVFYAVNKQLELFVLTRKSTQKYVNIQHNKHVAFVVTDEKNYVTLQGKGEISEISGGADTISAFNLFIKVIAKNIHWPPPVEKTKGGIVILKIKPAWLRCRDYTNSKDFISDSTDYFLESGK